MSHAMMSHEAAKVEKAEASEHGDCHKMKHSDATQKTAQNEKDHSGKCCDKGMCKCVGGNCHNLSKYFGNGIISLSSFSSDSSVFTFDNQFVESALANRLKRPPKA